MNNMSADKIINYLENYFDIINTYFTLPKDKKNVSFEEIFQMTKDIDVMLTDLATKDYKEAGKIAIVRVIPFLNLMLKICVANDKLALVEKFLHNTYRIASRISLEHYFIYREWYDSEKFFAPRYEILRGYIHYLQEIVTNPKFELIIFNAPSGYGKSYPEKISEAWAFGVDPSGTVLSLCSNEDVVLGGSRTVIDEIKSEWFGEVFPDLKYSPEDKDFFLKETAQNWKLRQCQLPSSYIAKTVQSNVVGTRASQRIHIDDLYADYYEAMNKSLNEYYYNKYLTVWCKRFVQNKIPKIVVTGTLWATGDFIDLLIHYQKRRYKFNLSKKYKYTLVNEENTVAIIQVPALDYFTGESTCPELRSTTDILIEKDSMDEYLFQTNFQQLPTDPEDLFFSYDKLRSYEKLPISEEALSAYAVIDATRKSGKDNFSMPIFVKNITNDSVDYYLKDCIFTKTATKDLYDEIVDKIITNHIITLVIESNVTSELANALKNRLHARGQDFCTIIEKYNTLPKAVRIEQEKGIISKRLVFPQKGMFGRNTDIGRFMDNLTSYSGSGRNDYDDGADSCAMFASEIIEEKSKPNRVKAILRPF